MLCFASMADKSLTTIDPLNPPATVLVKLGSALVHVDEMLSNKSHQFDRISFDQILKDPEVKAWLYEMDKLALLPVKR